MPRVSVVIPTYSRARFLRPAIQSVLNQTFQDFEILVVDDASDDETANVVRSFTDSRLHCLRHETNRGQGRTRNDGISRTSGEYIALLDDDDEWLPRKLEKQVRLLDNSPPEVGLVYTGFLKIDGASRRVLSAVHPEKRGQVLEELCVKNWIGTCSTVLVRRVCFERVGLFDEDMAAAVDYDMWLRIAGQFAIDYIREPLVLYRVHDRNLSSNFDTVIRGKEVQLEKYRHLFSRNRKSYSDRYLSLGVLYCFNHQTGKGREAFLKAIRLDPFNPRHYCHFGLSVFGATAFRKIKRYWEKKTSAPLCV